MEPYGTGYLEASGGGGASSSSSSSNGAALPLSMPVPVPMLPMQGSGAFAGQQQQQHQQHQQHQQQGQQQLGQPAAAESASASASASASVGGMDDFFGGDLNMFLNEGLDDIDQDTSLTEQERKEKRDERLERNREIARNCRKRKRERVEALMDEVSFLRETNRQLELKLKMAQNKVGEATSGRGNRDKEQEDKRLREVRSMTQMLEQKCTDGDITKRLKTYTEVYSDFGEERNKLVKVHMSQLEQLLLPTQVSKMLLWLLQQDEEFYKDDNPDSMWTTLCAELGLDEDQKTGLKAQRGALGNQNASMKKCLVSLNKFASSIHANMTERRKQVGKILGIITPVQIVKFLQWVEDNQVCIHMLDNLWTVNAKREQEIIKEMM